MLFPAYRKPGASAAPKACFLTKWLPDRSMVCAADLFVAGFASDPMSPLAGRRYRRLVLEPGSSVPENQLLKDFLGRELSSQAIFDQLSL